MAYRDPARGARTISGVVAFDDGVGDMFDQVQVVDRGRFAVPVSAFEGVIKHIVEFAVFHRGVAGSSSRVDVLFDRSFRRKESS